jgi:hypothetical protein
MIADEAAGEARDDETDDQGEGQPRERRAGCESRPAEPRPRPLPAACGDTRLGDRQRVEGTDLPEAAGPGAGDYGCPRR